MVLIIKKKRYREINNDLWPTNNHIIPLFMPKQTIKHYHSDESLSGINNIN